MHLLAPRRARDDEDRGGRVEEGGLGLVLVCGVHALVVVLCSVHRTRITVQHTTCMYMYVVCHVVPLPCSAKLGVLSSQK